MYCWNDPDDRVAIAQMNAELRHAQLDLLSARCSADRLRLRFSAQDLASHAERDVLRKAISHAAALSDYYLSIEKQMGNGNALSEAHVDVAVRCVAQYLLEQQQKYARLSQPLTSQHRSLLQPFFSPGLLDRVTFVELRGERISRPSFYEKAEALGVTNLPELEHMASLTFVDVIVFNEHISHRALFHALVHAAQFEILGLERYADLFVRGFARTQAHFNVPLETQAFALESRFFADPEKTFSVEDQIRLWLRDRRY